VTETPYLLVDRTTIRVHNAYGKLTLLLIKRKMTRAELEAVLKDLDEATTNIRSLLGSLPASS
jgi:hypothetical protein